MLARSALHNNQVQILGSFKDRQLKSFSLRLVEAELNSCLKATGTKGFFYKSELLAPSATIPLATSATTILTTTLAPATTASSSSEAADNISHVTNDNDNLTLPPLGVTNPSPGVDIELEVIRGSNENIS